MKFLVTAVALSRHTRRRMGKARTEVIDTESNRMFRDVVLSGNGPSIPEQIEEIYESFWNEAKTREIVKVVDIRELEDEPVCRRCELPGSKCECEQGDFA